RSDKCCHVEYRTQLDRSDAKRNQRRSVIVNHSPNVGSGAIDLSVDEAFRIQCSALCVDSVTIEVELDEVGCRYEFRCERSRHDESVDCPIMARADMTEAVKHSLLSKYPICSDEIFNERGIRRPCGCRRLLSPQHGMQAE